jgi:thiol-disulfide isomerase/thioredoxin
MLLLISVLLLWFGRPYWQAKTAPMAMSAEAGQPEVILYATEWCGYCKMTRASFQANDSLYRTRYRAEFECAHEHRKLREWAPLIVVKQNVDQQL